MNKIISYAIPVLIIGIILTGVFIVIPNLQNQEKDKVQVGKEERFRTFNSAEEIKNFLIENTKRDGMMPWFISFSPPIPPHPSLPPSVRISSVIEPYSLPVTYTGFPPPPGPPPPLPTPTFTPVPPSADTLMSTASAPTYYSKTNVQVEGVDEADIVKTDGEYIYAFINKEIVIVKAYPVEEARIVSKINIQALQNQWYPQVWLYVYQDKLIVIFVKEHGMAIQEITVTSPSVEYAYTIPYYYPLIYTTVLVYNIKERSNPNLEWNVTMEGSYVASRMIKENVYIITANPIISNEVKLPVIYNNDEKIQVKPSDIYYTPYADFAFQMTMLVNLNVINQNLEYKGFLLGATNTIYVSLKNIYITQYIYSLRWFQGTLKQSTEQDYTVIHRINIQNGIKYEAVGKVPGFLLNQFSMDEYKEYFRVATTSLIFTVSAFTVAPTETTIFNPPPISPPPIPTTSNNIYILNMDLQIVGKIENIEIGERIYSVRFVQEKCYLVTFRQIDPFFVIDLSDVKNPKILGYLKIPGFSTYLHPINETMILGIGQEEWSQVKISLFDVSDFNNPKEVSKIIIGNRSQHAFSEALYEHKAFLFDPLRKLIILPFLISNHKFYSINGTVQIYNHTIPIRWDVFTDWQGVLVFEIKDKIYLKGNVTHMNFEEIFKIVQEKLMNRDYYFYIEIIDKAIKRALFIEDFLYTISDSKIKINNIHTLEEIKEIKLN